MPPKVKITKEDIVNTAVMLIRGKGEEAVNARAIAAHLNCSTQPVFSNFATMEELLEEAHINAYNRYLGFIKNEVESGKYPVYKSFGMAYIRFAKEEKELFKFLFMRDRTGVEMAPSPDFEEAVQLIMQANGVTEEAARLIQLEMWTCVHGIGTMLATSYLPLEWELIENILTDIYQGIRAKHTAKEEKQ